MTLAEIEATLDAYMRLQEPAANDNAAPCPDCAGRGEHGDGGWPDAELCPRCEGTGELPHVGMNGKPCRCTPERRARYTRGCAETCPCHGLPHAECPEAHPCYGDCGRMTTPHETIAGGYCVHCAADAGWRGIT